MYGEYFHPIGFFLFILLITFFITNIIIWKRRNSEKCYYNSSSPNAMATLDNRLAKGEVSLEEYKEIKETLKH
ncbi:hypothetical protein [Virgibacillus sp. L01]|uniref:hypothetical protein n=1 Tax=Virgibacillus sp. L01 TaxID=3457429 RepID=UPI003FD2E636